MTSRMTQSDLDAAVRCLREEAAAAGILAADADLTAVNRGTGWWLTAGGHELPWWMNAHLGGSLFVAHEAVVDATRAVWAHLAAFERAASMSVSEFEAWRVLVRDGMAPVTAIATARALDR